MAHFFGAVSEMRTSGLMPSWLGSSTSQPEEGREGEEGEEFKARRMVRSICGGIYPVCEELTPSRLLFKICPRRGAAWRTFIKFVFVSLRARCPRFVRPPTWGHIHAGYGDLDLLQGDQNAGVGLSKVGTVGIRAHHGINHQVVGIVYELHLNRSEPGVNNWRSKKVNLVI